MSVEILESEECKGYIYRIYNYKGAYISYQAGSVFIPKENEWWCKELPVKTTIEPLRYYLVPWDAGEEYGVPADSWAVTVVNYSDKYTIAELGTALFMIINQLDGLRRMTE